MDLDQDQMAALLKSQPEVSRTENGDLPPKHDMLNDPYAWLDENERDSPRRGSQMGTPVPVKQATKAEADRWWRLAVGDEIEGEGRNEQL